MQRVALRGGVEWLDDSKGTNVGATVAALNGLSKKAVLILGGEGKGQNFAPLVLAVREHAKQVLLIGRDAALIEKALVAAGVPPGTRCIHGKSGRACGNNSWHPVTRCCCRLPCASFDMFRDYKHRGDVFAAAVKAL